MVGWSNVPTYVNKEEFCTLGSSSSTLTFYIRPAAILLLVSSPAVNGGLICSSKMVVTLALNHAQLLCLFFFFVLSFLSLCVSPHRLPPAPCSPFHPYSILFLLSCCVACSEICTRKSSAPLRTCSWMAKTHASCCSPGVASAFRGTFSSECAERTPPTTQSSRSVLVSYRRLSTTPQECLPYRLHSATLTLIRLGYFKPPCRVTLLLMLKINGIPRLSADIV